MRRRPISDSCRRSTRHELELSAGRALVFYPQATDARCTAALLLDVDPVGLVHSRGPGAFDFGLEGYVNDRPYVASSLMSVAISTAFRSAMAGESRQRPQLAATPLPLEVSVPVLPCRAGERRLRELFEPVGYAIYARPLPLDERFPEWGASPYFSLKRAAQGPHRNRFESSSRPHPSVSHP